MATTGNRFFHLSLSSPAFSRLEEAEQFFLAGNLNEALAAAQQAWREHPTEPDVFRVLAYIHMARGEYPPAAQAGYHSVTIDSENPASYATLTQVYLTFNMLSHAEETLVLARQRFADDPALLVLAADLRFRQHRDREGAEIARTVLEQHADDHYAKALLGTYALRAKRYGQACELLTPAVAAYPQRWDYLRDLGIAQLHLRQYYPARTSLTQAFLLNPTDLGCAQHLCFALKFTRTAFPSFWMVTLFLYNNIWLGWLLEIFALLMVLIGGIWLRFSLANAGAFSFKALLWLLAGIGLIVFTHAGLTMRSRKGKKFHAMLHNAITHD